jgi:hypothetical protein
VKNRKIVAQPSPGKKRDPMFKITRTNRAGGMAQAAELSPEFKPQYHQNQSTNQSKMVKKNF